MHEVIIKMLWNTKKCKFSLQYTKYKVDNKTHKTWAKKFRFVTGT